MNPLADPAGSGFWAAWGWYLGSAGDLASALIAGVIVAGLALLANVIGTREEEKNKPADTPEGDRTGLS
jgi:hypothetical protein